LTGLDVHTVARGRQELLAQDIELERIRLAGRAACRWKKTPEIIDRLTTLLEPETAGDPIPHRVIESI
jgi:hypothetical protein